MYGAEGVKELVAPVCIIAPDGAQSGSPGQPPGLYMKVNAQ